MLLLLLRDLIACHHLSLRVTFLEFTNPHYNYLLKSSVMALDST